MNEETADERPEVDLLLRKSKVVREGERALSIRAQEERGRRWAEEEGYRVRKVWKENLSAWSDVQRPKYDAAMDAVLHGEVPALWVYALDRFSRKGAESVVPILGKARVIFDYERLDSMSERDRRWIIDRAENAREYSARLSYNIKSTKSRQRNEGRWLNAAPYGFIADPKTRRLSPNRSHIPGKKVSYWGVIERVFKSVADNKSAHSIAREFNKEGIKAARGGGWTANTVRLIVINPVYEGWLTVTVGRLPTHYLNPEGERILCVEEATVTDLIAPELATRARQALSGRGEGQPAKPGTATHLISGRLKCAGCEGPMGYMGHSYRCLAGSNKGTCPMPAAAYATALDAYIVTRWLARMEHSEDDDPLMVAAAQRWTALSKPAETGDVINARSALREAATALAKFHADDRAGFYDGRSAKYRLPAKREREARLDAAEERLAALTGGGTLDISFLRNGHAEAAWNAATPATRRDLLGLLIDHVTVRKSETGNGTRFDGATRCVITWAEPEEEDGADLAV